MNGNFIQKINHRLTPPQFVCFYSNVSITGQSAEDFQLLNLLVPPNFLLKCTWQHVAYLPSSEITFRLYNSDQIFRFNSIRISRVHVAPSLSSR